MGDPSMTAFTNLWLGLSEFERLGTNGTIITTTKSKLIKDDLKVRLNAANYTKIKK